MQRVDFWWFGGYVDTMNECKPYIWKFIADEEYRDGDLVHWFSTYPKGMEDAGEITILAGYE